MPAEVKGTTGDTCRIVFLHINPNFFPDPGLRSSF